MIALPKSAAVNTGVFGNLLDLDNLTNSYKIYWFYAIFDEIKYGRASSSNLKINFKTIITRMICKCWYSLMKYRLHLGAQDQIGIAVNLIHDKYSFASDISENDLFKNILSIEDKEINKKLDELAIYVPYRLLSPFFTKETRGLKDHLKNNLISELSRNDTGALYAIYDDHISINPNWFDYIFDNQTIIEGWLKFKLIHFLQTRNPNVPAIAFKLEPPGTRNLAIAREFWKCVIPILKPKDLYTGAPINETNFSVDHFIPWSFVLHDQLWNLLPTERSVNSAKSDMLPDIDAYLDRFCELQFRSYATALSMNLRPKLIEDYLSITSETGHHPKEIGLQSFNFSLQKVIRPLHQIAMNQGFGVWTR